MGVAITKKFSLLVWKIQPKYPTKLPSDLSKNKEGHYEPHPKPTQRGTRKGLRERDPGLLQDEARRDGLLGGWVNPHVVCGSNSTMPPLLCGPTCPHLPQKLSSEKYNEPSLRTPTRRPRSRTARCIFRTKVFEVMRPGGARKGAPAHQRPRGRLVRLPGGGIALRFPPINEGKVCPPVWNRRAKIANKYTDLFFGGPGNF